MNDKIPNLGTTGLSTLITLVKTALGLKVDKVEGKGLSTNDFTNEEKAKLDGIAEGATNVSVVDNLTSGDASAALSANQGRTLKNMFSDAYKDGGKKSFANLPTANWSDMNTVYKITDDFTTTDKFVCGAGKSFAAGSMVVVTTIKPPMSVGDQDAMGYDVLFDASKTTIVDNLTSTDAAAALSANQGKVLDEKISAVEAKGYQTADDVAATVNAKISSVYKPGGSVAFAALPTADEAHLGMVYNVTDEFTTNENFLDSAGKSYPAGTNVVVVADGSEFKYDVLAGFIDLSGYVASADLQEVTSDEVTNLWNSITV